ncbi:hypothetical protein [Marinicrinis sediminis]|uniref:Uncharacterized protein n=1 Tax=Marinicrinis sediminis TaxID=1652465 RepID=A0ABW5REW3_9BACL
MKEVMYMSGGSKFLMTVLVLLTLVGAFSTSDRLFFILLIGTLGSGVLYYLSIIVHQVRQMNIRMLGLPLTNAQIDTIIQHSPTFTIESDDFDVHEPFSLYALCVIDGESYLSVRVFTKYVQITEYELVFEWPDLPATIIHCENQYVTGASAFEHVIERYVSCSALGLKMEREGNVLKLSMNKQMTK